MRSDSVYSTHKPQHAFFNGILIRAKENLHVAIYSVREYAASSYTNLPCATDHGYSTTQLLTESACSGQHRITRANVWRQLSRESRMLALPLFSLREKLGMHISTHRAVVFHLDL